jgi:hypothetical protein
LQISARYLIRIRTHDPESGLGGKKGTGSRSRNTARDLDLIIPDPDLYLSRIPDLGSKNSNKREGAKKNIKNMGLGSVIRYLIRHPGSGKNLFRIPASKSHPIPGSGSTTLEGSMNILYLLYR